MQRLIDYRAEETGQRVDLVTLRQLLKRNAIVLSRPQHKMSRPDPSRGLKKRLKTGATT